MWLARTHGKRYYASMSSCNNTVYLIRNKVDGKCYVGVTKNLKQRLAGHRSHSTYGKMKINEAIRYFGWDSFTVDILLDDVPDEMRDEAEEFFIWQMHSVESGYNKLRWGTIKDHASDLPKDPNWIASVTKSNKIKPLDKNWIEALRNSMLSRKKTEAWTRAHAIAMKKRRGLILCVETGVVYDGYLDAQKKTGIGAGIIHNACSGKYRTKKAGGFHWKKYLKRSNHEHL